MSYHPEPLRHASMWTGTVSGTTKGPNGVEVEVGVRVKVIADSFERAAVLAIDAAFTQAKESNGAIRNLELVALEKSGVVFFTNLDVYGRDRKWQI